jgi:predicted Co/Zn/Cd cation transporter (cation efflux family)
MESWVPYLDGIALLVMALIMLPMPVIGLWRSMTDVLQVAPEELSQRVHDLMDSLVRERGFLDYSSYVAKVGRGRFVEIHVLVPPDARIDTAQVDGIRSEISARLDAGSEYFWLTVDFTADRRWL